MPTYIGRDVELCDGGEEGGIVLDIHLQNGESQLFRSLQKGAVHCSYCKYIVVGFCEIVDIDINCDNCFLLLDGFLVTHLVNEMTFTEEDSLVLKRRRRKIQRLEQKQTNKLFAAKHIGRITEKKQQVEVYISNKRVNFKWQRGIKIGR